MALVVLLVFSIFGFVAAIVGFLGFDVTVATAFLMYFGLAVGAPGGLLLLYSIVSRIVGGRNGGSGADGLATTAA